MKYPEPTEPGLYLARGSTYKWWNYVVFVHEKSPFLKAVAWGVGSSSSEDALMISGLVWGPRIEEPEVDRKDVKASTF